MHIKLIAVGTRMPSWVSAAYKEYAQRICAGTSLKLVEIPLKKRSKNADLKKIKEEEGRQLLEISSSDYLIALDSSGQQWDTPTLAKQLEHWQTIGNHISLIIGGPEGLSSDCLKKANLIWSLSKLTLPHPLVRIVVAEQLYRACSIIKRHPYHK